MSLGKLKRGPVNADVRRQAQRQLSGDPIAVSPEESVKLAIQLISESRSDSDDLLLARMVDNGFDRDLANRVSVLIPLAFSRAHYESFPMIKEYAEEYIVYDQSTGNESAHALESDPYYAAASTAALALTDNDNELLVVVASRSSEYDAINNVLTGLPDGATPERIGTSTPYVLCGDPPPRPWWKFWAQ